MFKISLSVLICLLLFSCATGNKPGASNQEYVENFSCPGGEKQKKSEDMSDCSLEISIPHNAKKEELAPSKWIALGEARGMAFRFGLNKGHYWVEITRSSIFSKTMEAEVILNIKSAGSNNPESINLIKVSETMFKGFGFQRTGMANFVLIYKLPKQKEILFDFDLEAN